MSRTSRKIATRTSRSLAANSRKPRASGHKGTDLQRIEDAARQAGWEVRRTSKGHVQLLPPDKSLRPIHVGGSMGDPRAIKNVESELRRAGLDLGRESRRLKRNIHWSNMSVPYPVGRSLQDRIAWSQRAFAVGTPVKFLTDKKRFSWGQATDISPGTRGEVVHVDPGNFVTVRIVDSRYPDGSRNARIIGRTVTVSLTSAAMEMEALVDNFASSQGSPIPRHRLPASQKRTSRKMRPNRFDSRDGAYVMGRSAFERGLPAVPSRDEEFWSSSESGRHGAVESWRVGYRDASSGISMRRNACPVCRSVPDDED